jgi:hypothetical protein
MLDHPGGTVQNHLQASLLASCVAVDLERRRLIDGQRHSFEPSAAAKMELSCTT